nr:LysR substrate-binding domain-containing protein [Mesorhizobium zhangyense]
MRWASARCYQGPAGNREGNRQRALRADQPRPSPQRAWPLRHPLCPTDPSGPHPFARGDGGTLDGHGGRLAVGTVMGAVPLLNDHLPQLLERQPTIRVELVKDTSAHLLNLLDSGRLEIAICRTSVS